MRMVHTIEGLLTFFCFFLNLWIIISLSTSRIHLNLSFGETHAVIQQRERARKHSDISTCYCIGVHQCFYFAREMATCATVK